MIPVCVFSILSQGTRHKNWILGCREPRASGHFSPPEIDEGVLDGLTAWPIGRADFANSMSVFLEIDADDQA
jgi:hypothetical protein